MIETPELLTVPADARWLPVIREHLDAGGVVRVINYRTGSVEYRTRQRPECLAGLEDDIARLMRMHRDRLSMAAKSGGRAANLRKGPEAIRARAAARKAALNAG